jgi:hypothetical protein
VGAARCVSEVRPDRRTVADRVRDEATTNGDDQIAGDRFTEKGRRFDTAVTLIEAAEPSLPAERVAVGRATARKP